MGTNKCTGKIQVNWQKYICISLCKPRKTPVLRTRNAKKKFHKICVTHKHRKVKKDVERNLKSLSIEKYCMTLN